jgi:hypothetical protein
VSGTTTQAVASPGAGGGLFGPGGWVERNGTLVGNAVSGLGGGLLRGMAAKDEARSIEERDRRRAANYSTSGDGLMTRAATGQLRAGAGNPTVAEKYDPLTRRIEYRYNPETGQVDRYQVA